MWKNIELLTKMGKNDEASLILLLKVTSSPRSGLQLIESFDTSLTIASGDLNMDKLIMTYTVFIFLVCIYVSLVS